MTILTVLRHAKSSLGEAGMDDFDRPLNDRGRMAARRLGHELKNRHIRFDRVIASPAARVRETLKEIAHGYANDFDVRFDERIYAASVETLLKLVRMFPEDVDAPLLVGHNPGLQELLVTLARDDGGGLRRRVSAKFPTSALAIVALSATGWDEVSTDSGEIRELIIPGELD